jgi:hypothetical protein
MTEGHPIKAGALYSVVVFSAGFVLGALRVIWIAPLAGDLAAVALEAPIMLAFSWHACCWAAERMAVSERLMDRLLMGAVALALLLLAEAAIGVIVRDQSLDDYFRSYGQTAMLLGLLAQLAFGVFPMLQRRRLA